MKPTKIILTLITITFATSVSILAQDGVCKIDKFLNKTQQTEIEKAVSLYWDGKTPEAKQAVGLLEKITEKEPDNWYAPYWVSYISTQVVQDEKNNLVYLEKAEQYFDKANRAFTKKSDKSAIPYFHALHALIYRFKSNQFTGKDWAKFGELRKKSLEEVNKGIAISPDNPVLMVLAATGIGRNRAGDLRQTIAAVALLEKAKVEFKKITDRSPADITYWNEHWINFWIKSLKKQDK